METIETSGELFRIVEDREVFKPYEKVNGQSGKWMQIEHSSDDEDGPYPLIMHYVTLANKMDREGVSAWLDRMGTKKNKLIIELGYSIIERTSQYGNDAVMKFDNPIRVLFGQVGDELIIKNVSAIEGEFDFEWFWMKGVRRQNKIANGFEIYFNCKKFY